MDFIIPGCWGELHGIRDTDDGGLVPSSLPTAPQRLISASAALALVMWRRLGPSRGCLDETRRRELLASLRHFRFEAVECGLSQLLDFKKLKTYKEDESMFFFTIYTQ